MQTRTVHEAEAEGSHNLRMPASSHSLDSLPHFICRPLPLSCFALLYSQLEFVAYDRVAQVAKKLASVQRAASAEQLKANGLMDDELHHLNTIGSLTLAQVSTLP